ncbi:transmembrane protein 174 [Centroberyx affinis]|uniref:transmembrane protein 174 n=1 Tax=Centroberyx affinis TaxID=166261 RepID=UPI003A5C050D
MKQQELQVFWNNMMRQSPQMETSGARNPVINDTSVIPSPARSDGVLDGEKTGATLLFFGISLGLVGLVFIAVGWLHHASHSFESTKLLGPVLLSVGGAFMLTSVCKFGVISCQCCRQRDEEEDVMSKMEQIPTGHSPVFNGVSQPIMFRGAIVMRDIPPLYASETLEINPTKDSFPVPMEVRLDEHAIIRSSRPGSVGLRVQARSWDSLAFISIQWEKLIRDERWDPLGERS